MTTFNLEEIPVEYLSTLMSLVAKNYIQASVDRRLTETGWQTVAPYFSNLNLEHILKVVRVFSHDRKEIVKTDSFVYETADLLITITTSPDKEKIEIEQRRMNIHAGVYVLAAIYVLQEADKKSLVEINPRSAPRDGNYYIRYNFSLTP